jgi:hypothetical protein
MTQAVEGLFCKCKALSPNPSPTKTKTNKQKIYIVDSSMSLKNIMGVRRKTEEDCGCFGGGGAVVVVFELRASCLLGRHSTIRAIPFHQPFFVLGSFKVVS